MTDKCATPWCRRPTIMSLPNGTQMCGPCNAARLDRLEKQAVLKLNASLQPWAGLSMAPSSFSGHRIERVLKEAGR